MAYSKVQKHDIVLISIFLHNLGAQNQRKRFGFKINSFSLFVCYFILIERSSFRNLLIYEPNNVNLIRKSFFFVSTIHSIWTISKQGYLLIQLTFFSSNATKLRRFFYFFVLFFFKILFLLSLLFLFSIKLLFQINTIMSKVHVYLISHFLDGSTFQLASDSSYGENLTSFLIGFRHILASKLPNINMKSVIFIRFHGTVFQTLCKWNMTECCISCMQTTAW